MDVNNHGLVVGYSDMDSTILHAPLHTFAWTESTGMVDLGTLGGDYSKPVDVNDAGEVVGWSCTVEGSPNVVPQHAFLWTATTGMVSLGTLGGLHSAATAVNAQGWVVGLSSTAANASHAFLWTATDGMEDLGTLGGANERSRHQ